MWFLEIYFLSGREELYCFETYDEMAASREGEAEYFGDVIDFFVAYFEIGAFKGREFISIPKFFGA